MEKIVLLKEDMLVNLRTRFGNSLFYQALPLVNDYITIETFGDISLLLSVIVSVSKPRGTSSKSLDNNCS